MSKIANRIEHYKRKIAYWRNELDNGNHSQKKRRYYMWQVSMKGQLVNKLEKLQAWGHIK